MKFTFAALLPLALFFTSAIAEPIPAPEAVAVPQPVSENPATLVARQWSGPSVPCNPSADWNCYCWYYPNTQACIQRDTQRCWNDWSCRCWRWPNSQGCRRQPTCQPGDWYCYCYWNGNRDARCRQQRCNPWDRNCCQNRWDRNCCDWRGGNRDPRCRWGSRERQWNNAQIRKNEEIQAQEKKETA